MEAPAQLHKSFIPKEPMAKRKMSGGGGGGFVIFTAITIFIISLLALGGAYVYQSVVKGEIESLRASIRLAEESFESETLETYQELDHKLRLAENLLDEHITLAPLFQSLEQLTVQGVRYTSFSYRKGEITAQVEMNGEAVGLPLVALQARAFGEEPRILNPIFSNLTLETDGKVSFQVAFNVDTSLTSYVNYTAF